MARHFYRDVLGRGNVYTCLMCGKKTRDTGHDEAGVELCLKCFEKCTAENEHNDYHDIPVAGCPYCNG